MEFLKKFCNIQKYADNIDICSFQEDKNIEIPKEYFIAIIFQNIAYTGSSNYKKWFYNTYKNKNNQTIKRERRYSLDENIDFDICQTERKINKTESMETIYENFFYDNEPIYVYYLPFSNHILPYFEKYLDDFTSNIISKKIEKGKIKYFEKNNKVFVSFLFNKNIELSSDIYNLPLGKKTIKISRTIQDIWEELDNHHTLLTLINELLNNEEIIFVSHYKNSIFTDYIVYHISQLFSMKLKYCSIGSTNYFPDFFYKKLDKIVEYYHFGNYNKGNVKNYVDVNDKSTFNCCNYNPENYRKNLKRISIKILQDFS